MILQICLLLSKSKFHSREERIAEEKTIIRTVKKSRKIRMLYDQLRFEYVYYFYPANHIFLFPKNPSVTEESHAEDMKQ